MDNKKIYLALSVAASFIGCGDSDNVNNVTDERIRTTTLDMCIVMDKEGNNLVKNGKNDCATIVHSCAGQKISDDDLAWVYTPEGYCKYLLGYIKERDSLPSNLPSDVASKINAP